MSCRTYLCAPYRTLRASYDGERAYPAVRRDHRAQRALRRARRWARFGVRSSRLWRTIGASDPSLRSAPRPRSGWWPLGRSPFAGPAPRSPAQVRASRVAARCRRTIGITRQRVRTLEARLVRGCGGRWASPPVSTFSSPAAGRADTA